VCILLGRTPVGAQDQEKPHDLGLTERAERRLVQVELTVDGPPEAVAALTPADLRVRVGGVPIHDFHLDVTCPSIPGMDEAQPRPAHESGSAPGPASVALFFDQSHLTVSGRVRAYASAQTVANALIGAGHRVQILSNGRSLTRRTPWTNDPRVVGSAIQSLVNDPTQVDATSTAERMALEALLKGAQELDAAEQRAPPDPSTDAGRGPRSFDGGSRVQRRDAEIAAAAGTPGLGGTSCASDSFDHLIRRIEDLHDEATQSSEASFDRLSTFLFEMERTRSPRAVIVYADSLRRVGGSAFLDLLDTPVFRSLRERCPNRRERVVMMGARGRLARDASFHIDALLAQASARRVRLHAVEAQGLSDENTSEAQHTLASLALETGGRAFLGAGTDPLRISEAVIRDATCPVVLSFDPVSLPTGRLVNLSVKSAVESVAIRAPGLLFSETPEASRRAQFLAAALSAGSQPGEPPVLLGVIPLGRERGEYVTLVQVIAPPRERRAPRWELGAVAIDRDVVIDERTGSVTARPAGVPAVLEATMRIPAPAPVLVGVGRDVEADEVGAMRRQEDWPNLRAARAGLSPLALVQPSAGGFVRDGQTRTAGSLAVLPELGPDAGRPLALLGLACRGRKEKGGLVVERVLSGEEDYPFPAIPLEVAQEECAQFRDAVPAGTLGKGTYRYRVRIVSEGEELASRTVTFSIAAGD
jgi:hypothetical protein